MVMLHNSGSAARSLKANTRETSVDWKRKIAIFRRPAIWREGGLMSENQLQRFCSTVKVFKGRKGKLITVNHLRRWSESSLSFTVCRLSSDWLVVR